MRKNIKSRLVLLAVLLIAVITDAEARSSSNVEIKELAEIDDIAVQAPASLIRELLEAVSPEIAERREITKEEEKHEKIYEEEGHRGT